MKPFRVEVAIAAPHEAVWRALTEPEEIRRWFGWDYDGLDAEIRYIFADHAMAEGRERIVLTEGDDRQSIELEPDGPRTRVRIERPGGAAGGEDADAFDALEEGWRTFLEQLRHQLERHPGGERRTLHFTGDAVGADVVAAVRAALPGEPWHESARQWMLASPEHGDCLAGVDAREPLASGASGPVALTIVTFDLNDEAFAAVRDTWTARWTAVTGAPGPPAG
jgi:uncharacterized protein YndB with AHSA1/START domain